MMGLYQRGSLIDSMLITALFPSLPEGHHQLNNEVDPQKPAKRIHGILTSYSSSINIMNL